MFQIAKVLSAAALATVVAAVAVAGPAGADFAPLNCPSCVKWTARVSLTEGDQQAFGNSGGGFNLWETPSISANGRYVAFVSYAALVSQDVNGSRDVYVRDRVAGTTTLVSVNQWGQAAIGESRFAAISGDGRYVAFSSTATDVVPGDVEQGYKLYLRDLQTATTAAVLPGQSDNCAVFPRLSADGRYVAFVAGDGLVPGDANGGPDVFVRDMQTSALERVSVPFGQLDVAGSYSSDDLDISSDGRYVAFATTASQIVSGDSGGKKDVFLRDRQAGTTVRVSDRSVSHDEANGDSYQPSVSDDGNRVVFASQATNLVWNDVNGKTDVFLRNVASGASGLVSKSTDGQQGTQHSDQPSISADGNRVAFTSNSINLVSNQYNGWAEDDVFLRDFPASTTTRVSVNNNWESAEWAAHYPQISNNGAFVAFTSGAQNLVADDTNNAYDVFLRKV